MGVTAVMKNYFIRMLVFGVCVAAIVVFLSDGLWTIFQNNIGLNSLIIGVLFVGVILSFWTLIRLIRETRWLESFQQKIEISTIRFSPTILKSLAISMRDNHDYKQISSLSQRSILASVESRLDEMRDIPRYFVGLLIFLGLLGTFWGLSKTIAAIAGVVGNIDINPSNAGKTFELLKQGLQSPLAGMGTAFSSSLFGLAGSLVLGFLDLQVGKASSKFFRIVEDELSTFTKVNHDGSDVAHNGGAYIMSLLESNAEQVELLQGLIERSEKGGQNNVRLISKIAEHIDKLNQELKSQQASLKQLMTQNKDLHAHLSNTLIETRENTEIKAYLANVDRFMQTMLNDHAQGRKDVVSTLQKEVRLLTRTLSSVANGSSDQNYSN